MRHSAALIETAVRFVGEYQLRAVDHRARDRDTLLHAAAERAHGRVGSVQHRHPLQRRLDPRSGIAHARTPSADPFRRISPDLSVAASVATRTLLKIKRKSLPTVDENEDGARANLIEEGLTTWIFETPLR